MDFTFNDDTAAGRIHVVNLDSFPKQKSLKPFFSFDDRITVHSVGCLHRLDALIAVDA